MTVPHALKTNCLSDADWPRYPYKLNYNVKTLYSLTLKLPCNGWHTVLTVAVAYKNQV